MADDDVVYPPLPTNPGWTDRYTGRHVRLDDGSLVAQIAVDAPGRPAAADPIRPLPATGTTYFIGPADGPIKIGFASRLDVRVRDLRLANAFSLVVWASVEGPPSLEREYHRRFAAHRLHGEWFARVPEIEAEIARLAAARPNPFAKNMQAQGVGQ